MAVVGELVAADHGLGYYLIYANGQVDTVGAFVSLLLLIRPKQRCRNKILRNRMTIMKIGLVGLGKMGSAIASRLAAQGHAPLIWDRDQSVTQAHGAKGFQTATDARAVATESDVIISIISDDNAVRTLFNGERGFLSGGVVGKLFVEMTTLQPMTARELAAAVEAKGARLIDSPVLGSIPTAREGKLLALAGGTPEDLIRARAVHVSIGVGSGPRIGIQKGPL